MIGKDDYKIEIREGERYYGFYSVDTGKWISGCRKQYLMDVMVELQSWYMEMYGEEVYFKIGGYEDDSQVLRRLRNSSAGRYSD